MFILLLQNYKLRLLYPATVDYTQKQQHFEHLKQENSKKSLHIIILKTNGILGVLAQKC